MYIAAVRVSSIVPNKFFCHNILLQLDPSFPSLDTRGTKIRPASSFLLIFAFVNLRWVYFMLSGVVNFHTYLRVN